MAKTNAISVETLRQLLAYDSETGFLYWRFRPVEMFQDSGLQSQQHNANCWNGRNAGKRAFNAINKGYGYSGIFKKKFAAHRVAWALHHGAWPEEEIDHINGNRLDNRIENLRSVTKKENALNKRIRPSNTSGVTGVHYFTRKGKWTAYINIGGRRINTGYFVNKSDAVAARKAAEKELGFHPNHGS